MQKYKEAYFRLFSAMCDAIELQEQLLSDEELTPSVKRLLQSQTEFLKSVQQETEEMLTEDTDCVYCAPRPKLI